MIFLKHILISIKNTIANGLNIIKIFQSLSMREDILKLPKYKIKTLSLCLLFGVIVISCKTMPVKNVENIEANVLFKRIMKRAESLEYVNISSSVMISGNKLIPAVYIKMIADADYVNKKAILHFSVLSKKLFDIAVNPKEMTLINHTASQFITFPLEQVDLKELLGFNFDPIDISYFLTGNIPYAQEMQPMSFHNENQNLSLNITSNNSEYILDIDKSGRIAHVMANNQFFEPLNIDTLVFSARDGVDMPQKLKITSKISPISMTFLIKDVTYNKCSTYEPKIPEEYEKIVDINKIKINL